MTTSTATTSGTSSSQAIALARLEHINLTVSDPDATADLLSDLFGWHRRWSGLAKNDGYTVHVGTDEQYLALYRPPASPATHADGGSNINGLNHVAVVVDDLGELERRVRASGLNPFSFGDYEPGRRFYFLDRDGVEFEVVSYS